MLKNVIRVIVEVLAYKNVVGQLLAQHLILRYRRTVLGYFWTLLNPLLMMTVMAVVFANLFKADLKTFAVFLFAGMIPWNFFNSVVAQSSGSIISNEGLIKKIYIPKLIFPLGISLALFIDSLLSFFVLFAIILLLGGSLSWALLFLPVSFLLMFAFAFGLGVVASVATVYFRDLQYVIMIGLQGLFFLTPIFYKKETILGGAAWVINLNPLTPYISLFRDPILSGSLPDVSIITQTLFISTASLTLGLLVFIWVEKKIIYRL
jgi:ABC-type polysaccharide/polyol phosphate export permease